MSGCVDNVNLCYSKLELILCIEDPNRKSREHHVPAALCFAGIQEETDRELRDGRIIFKTRHAVGNSDDCIFGVFLSTEVLCLNARHRFFFDQHAQNGARPPTARIVFLSLRRRGIVPFALQRRSGASLGNSHQTKNL